MTNKSLAIVFLSLIFGMVFGWLEEVSSSLYIPLLNIINPGILTFLISLLIVFIFVSISDSFFIGALSISGYVILYILVKFLLLRQSFSIIFTSNRVISIMVVIIFSFIELLFIQYYSTIKNHYKDRINSIQFRSDIAFPVIVLLLSIVLSSIFVLLDQNIYFLRLPFSDFYLFVAIVIILSIASMNEISGFFVGFFSLAIYFLLLGLISIDFNLARISQDSRIAYTFDLSYAILFGSSTFFISRSFRLFIKGILLSKRIKELKPAK